MHFHRDDDRFREPPVISRGIPVSEGVERASVGVLPGLMLFQSVAHGPLGVKIRKELAGLVQLPSFRIDGSAGVQVYVATIDRVFLNVVPGQV